MLVKRKKQNKTKAALLKARYEKVKLNSETDIVNNILQKNYFELLNLHLEVITDKGLNSVELRQLVTEVLRTYFNDYYHEMNSLKRNFLEEKTAQYLINNGFTIGAADFTVKW